MRPPAKRVRGGRSHPLALLALLAAPLLAPAAWHEACAQDFPSRAIRIIVPFTPGGSTDVFARMLAVKMTENLRQTVLVENRPGGGTLIGAELVAKSPPDGHTLLLTSVTTYSINPSLHARLPYDALNDFAAVTLTARIPFVLVVGADVPAKSLRELVAHAKSRPGQLNFGSPGQASVHRLAMELLAQRAGLDLVHVPYKGSSPALQDMLAGRIALMFLGVDTTAETIRSGRIRALAIGSAQRFSGFPEVPTISEAGGDLGLRGFEAAAWQGIAVSARTPAAIVDKLNSEVARALADPVLRNRLVASGVETLQSTPEEFASYIRSETVKWADVIRRAKVTPE